MGRLRKHQYSFTLGMVLATIGRHGVKMFCLFQNRTIISSLPLMVIKSCVDQQDDIPFSIVVGLVWLAAPKLP